MSIISRLASLLQEKGIKDFYYFHTDHWEPSENVEEAQKQIENFISETNKEKFSEKLTLFYKLPIFVETVANSKWVMDGDMIGFYPMSEQSNHISLIKEVVDRTQHEFQVHIHHELWAYGGDSNLSSGSDYFAYSHLFPNGYPSHLDQSRFEFYLPLLLDSFKQYTGKRPKNWSFVHGLWALNASDSRVCNIHNEIEILMKNGCIADFTMPAGRSRVNSIHKYPFTCVPVAAPKGYDFIESDATIIGGVPKILDHPRFLIWNQRIPSNYSSFDYYSSANLEALGDTESYLETWIENAFSIGEKMFVKTHAHSFWKGYLEKYEGCIPHRHPFVIKIFEMLESICSEAGVKLHYPTVNEVIQILRKEDNILDQTLGAKGKQIISVHTDPARFMPADAPKEFNRQANKVAEEWADNNKKMYKELGNYYHIRYKRGQLLTAVDVEITRYILRTFPVADHRILEVGPGLGQCLLFLGYVGYSGIGFEASKHRCEAGNLLQDVFFTKMNKCGNTKIINGVFPDILKDKKFDETQIIDGITNIGLCANIVSSHTAGKELEILQALSRFDHLVIDLERFGKKRNDEEKQQLMELVCEVGFELKSPIYQISGVDLFHFSKSK